MKPHHRVLIQCLLILFLGALTVWPVTVVSFCAGVRWAVFAMFCAVAWGVVMGWTLRTTYD